MTLTTDEVLCFHCGRKHDIVSPHGIVLVNCPSRYTRDNLLKTECPAYIPIGVTDSNCTGDCEHCKIRTEWRAWAE